MRGEGNVYLRSGLRECERVLENKASNDTQER
jgi:hypothetical protein